MDSFVHIDKIYVLILGGDPTQGLDGTSLTVEAQHSINFSRLSRKFYLSLHYCGSNSFLAINATKIYQFNARDAEIKNNACV